MELAQARRIDAVLVTELSRWGRSTQDLGHAVAGALRGLRLNAGGHHAASRAGSTGVTK